MQQYINDINNILRPQLKLRVGTTANISGAERIAKEEYNTTSISASRKAYCMFLETIDWADHNLAYIYIPENAINDSEILHIGSICRNADGGHGKGSKTAIGAAIGGLAFGFIGAAIGAIAGWGLGQSSANNDLENIKNCAIQSIDYLCDVIVNKIRTNPVPQYNSPQNVINPQLEVIDEPVEEVKMQEEPQEDKGVLRILSKSCKVIE